MTDERQTMDDVLALVSDLRAEVKELRAKITPKQRSIRDSPKQTDHVAFGSDEHAAMLGLRKATKDDGEFVHEGWAFEDIAFQCGFNALPVIIMAKLRNAVGVLVSAPPMPQSDDRNAPYFAPRMFEPDKGHSFRRTSDN